MYYLLCIRSAVTIILILGKPKPCIMLNYWLYCMVISVQCDSTIPACIGKIYSSYIT